MVKEKFIKIQKILRELFRQRGISILKIIIFGSYATMSERTDSDIDLIIVSRDFRDKDIFEKVTLTGGIHRELVRKFKKPFDIMYYSDIEWEQGDSLIINVAKDEGNVIYG